VASLYPSPCISSPVYSTVSAFTLQIEDSEDQEVKNAGNW